jgi:tetratricopeptide (TPR) repeat protein
VRRRRKGPADIESEVLRLGGRRGAFYYQQLLAAADAFARGRDRDALRTLRPVRDALPDAASVRELMGLAHYRLGNFAAAATELDAFVELSNSVEQHPVLMDCYRARRRWRRVDELWEELAAASPSAELVTEGRIVLAGSLADRGRLGQAIAQLDKKSGDVKRPLEHHLRLWYALADLEERAGNLSRARELFNRVRTNDPDFADVALRCSALR